MANLQIILLLGTLSAVSLSWGKSLNPNERLRRRYQEDHNSTIPRHALMDKAAGADDCTHLDATDKIVGGTVTVENEYPSMVLCLLDGYLCGGTILNRWTILTAAHCVIGLNPDNSYVVVGEHHIDQSSGIEQKIGVKEFKHHPNYDSRTIQNDVALVHLEEAIVYTNQVSSACVSDSCPSGSNIQAGRNCVAVGWGTTTYQGSISRQLQHVNVTTKSTNECKSAYGHWFVEDKMICAGADSQGSCQGDSGGPLICGNAEVAVVSFGIRCGEAEYPGVYANLCWYTDWIKANLWTQ